MPCGTVGWSCPYTTGSGVEPVGGGVLPPGVPGAGHAPPPGAWLGSYDTCGSSPCCSSSCATIRDAAWIAAGAAAPRRLLRSPGYRTPYPARHDVAARDRVGRQRPDRNG